jgi:hypothetical protein
MKMAGWRAFRECRVAVRIRSFLVVTCVALVTSGARASSTADAAVAQALFDQAKHLVASGNAKDACPKFEESERLDPGTGTEFNLADCYERVGRVASAWTLYVQVAAESHLANKLDREKVAREHAEALATHLPKLVIDVPAASRVPGLTVKRTGTLVGEPQWGVPVPVDPGSQSVHAEAPGFEPWDGAIDVAGEGTVTIQIPALHALPASAAARATPARSTAPAHAATPTLKYVAYGLGAAGVIGLGIGTGFGVKAMANKDSAGCDGNDCPSNAAAAKYQDARTAGNIATVGFAVGGTLLAAGVVLYFVAPKKNAPSVDVTGSLGPGVASVSVRGAW